MSTAIGYMLNDSRIPPQSGLPICCLDCVKTHGRLNEVSVGSRLYKEHILPYSQTCHYCGKLMVDGFTRVNDSSKPLDLFDSPIDSELLKTLNQQCEKVFNKTCSKCGERDYGDYILYRPDLGHGLGPMLCEPCCDQARKEKDERVQAREESKLLKRQLEAEVIRLREDLATAHDQMDRMVEEQLERDQEIQLLRQALDRYSYQPREVVPPAPGLWEQVKEFSRNQYLAVAVAGLVNAAFGLAVGCLVVMLIAITVNGINDMILFNKDPQAAIERLQQHNEYIHLKRASRQLEEERF